MPDGKPTTWWSRCMVRGCKMFNKPVVTDHPPLPTDHPDSHYSQAHAGRGEISPRSKFL